MYLLMIILNGEKTYYEFWDLERAMRHYYTIRCNSIGKILDRKGGTRFLPRWAIENIDSEWVEQNPVKKKF